MGTPFYVSQMDYIELWSFEEKQYMRMEGRQKGWIFKSKLIKILKPIYHEAHR
jgi:hypothetical protein